MTLDLSQDRNGGPPAPATEVPAIRLPQRLREGVSFRRDQLGFLRWAARTQGDIFRFRVYGIPMIMLNHPDHIYRVLVGARANYDKDALLYRLVRPVLRDGLIGSPGGEHWQRQRRLIQPTMRPAVVAKFARNMTEETAGMLDRWDRGLRPGEVVDVHGEFGELALRIVNRSLFSAQVGSAAREFAAAFTEANALLGRFFTFPFPPLSVPTPSHLRLRRAISRMDGFVSSFIRERAAGPGEPGEEVDLLTLLMNAVDEKDGTSMAAEQLHHEVLNLVIGAYETTTNALAWIFYLLAAHPEVERRLHEEIDGVLGGRTATFEDMADTPYARSVVDETLRLYSPAWQFMRRAREEDTIGGHRVPARSNIYLNSYLLHRHPDLWDDPESFDPDRFTPERSKGRHRHAYMPFGGGERICVGQHFALTELHLVLITVARRYRFRLPAGRPPVRPLPLITLHPEGGVHLEVRPR
ncbi:cytochrome P450 [Streptomyces sp. TRM 70361]|uniref:cytochrome P450 n=1 Tax=Streptomyces sp. TRM 70361 TaxID=3116553 RepID=UPI002E7BE446|nr:cytochrome P450 [Streptomyces sp. TRM 70361]MEE1943384.1 cytochrome P450 [Streptomyces sp. TRM 70361]